MDIKNFRSIHKKAIQKLHDVVGAKIKVKFTNGTIGYVQGTLSDEKSSDMVNNAYVEREILSFCIVKQNLIDSGLPLKGFSMIEYNRESYEVLNTNESSTIGNAIIINCKKVG